MNPRDPNVGLVQAVAQSLGPLCSQFVFVGGCAAGLLITDAARPPVRATVDVDLIVEVATRAEYYSKLRKDLLQAGFTESGDVLCRWKVRGIVVDVMPTTEAILDFTNPWYEEAIRTAMQVVLPEGLAIKLIAPPLFVATKLEAFYGRGQGQYRTSHDMEDIITVVDGRPELVDEVAGASPEVRRYLEEEILDLLETPEFLEAVPWHFHGDAESQARVPETINRLRRIARV